MDRGSGGCFTPEREMNSSVRRDVSGKSYLQTSREVTPF